MYELGKETQFGGDSGGAHARVGHSEDERMNIAK